MKDFIHPRFLFALPGIRFLLCPGWETTAYEYDGEQGRFGFSSPENPVCQYSFRKVPAPPDMVRIWEEVHRRNFPDSRTKLRFEQLSEDILLVCSAKGERFYASRYEPERMRLHEWIFPTYSAAMETEARRMLSTVSGNPPDGRGYTLYALWGLEATLPPGFELEEISPYPANIELMFENKAHHKITLRRIGLAAYQLQNDTLARYYQELLMRKRHVVKKIGSRLWQGHEFARHEFRVRGKFGLNALLGPWWRGVGEAFLREEENRIYCMEHVAPSRLPSREKLEDIYGGKLS